MTSPLAMVYGRHQTHGRPDLDRPEGCDHDQSVYHYRLVDGAMVLRGIALGPRWESRPMDWRGLSCYKQRGDMQMALITKESGKPEARKDKPEIMAKAQVLIDGGMKITHAARELGVPAGTLHTWVSKARKKRDELAKHAELLESVDAGKPVRSMGCIEPELQLKATEVVTAPIGVEVPQYELDDEPVDDIPGPVMVEKEFDRKAFVIEMIESVMELSQLRNAPAEITLELIDAVLVVA